MSSKIHVAADITLYNKNVCFCICDIQDRHLTMETIEMVIEDEQLSVSFEIPITQSIDEYDDYDNAETIEMRGI